LGDVAQKPSHFFSKNEIVFFMPKPTKRAWGYLNKQDYCVILFGGCCSKTFPFFFKKCEVFFMSKPAKQAWGLGIKKTFQLR
jgi:hypothetical protein